jgi:hypothetical protein
MYKEKYLKYKSKYLELKSQIGGGPNIIQEGGVFGWSKKEKDEAAAKELITLEQECSIDAVETIIKEWNTIINIQTDLSNNYITFADKILKKRLIKSLRCVFYSYLNNDHPDVFKYKNISKFLEKKFNAVITDLWDSNYQNYKKNTELVFNTMGFKYERIFYMTFLKEQLKFFNKYQQDDKQVLDKIKQLISYIETYNEQLDSKIQELVVKQINAYDTNYAMSVINSLTFSINSWVQEEIDKFSDVSLKQILTSNIKLLKKVAVNAAIEFILNEWIYAIANKKITQLINNKEIEIESKKKLKSDLKNDRKFFENYLNKEKLQVEEELEKAKKTFYATLEKIEVKKRELLKERELEKLEKRELLEERKLEKMEKIAMEKLEKMKKIAMEKLKTLERKLDVFNANEKDIIALNQNLEDKAFEKATKAFDDKIIDIETNPNDYTEMTVPYKMNF